MTETFRCGHPRTPENTKKSPSTGARCRACLRASKDGDRPLYQVEKVFENLDAISRTRALTDKESIALERAIKWIDDARFHQSEQAA